MPDGTELELLPIPADPTVPEVDEMERLRLERQASREAMFAASGRRPVDVRAKLAQRHKSDAEETR